VLRYLDPSGFRWLKESWLLTDRGIAFYNPAGGLRRAVSAGSCAWHRKTGKKQRRAGDAGLQY
jgi:ABC-type phosphonate transport system ATPase subunit